jgi:hypothetical protein
MKTSLCGTKVAERNLAAWHMLLKKVARTLRERRPNLKPNENNLPFLPKCPRSLAKTVLEREDSQTVTSRWAELSPV